MSFSLSKSAISNNVFDKPIMEPVSECINEQEEEKVTPVKISNKSSFSALGKSIPTEKEMSDSQPKNINHRDYSLQNFESKKI